MPAAGLPRGLRAALRAGPLVPPLAACCGIIAAVLPGEPLDLMPDAQLARVQVRVLPPQPQRLALPQPACQAHPPARGVPAPSHGRDDRACLLLAERLSGDLLQPGGLHQAARVAGHVPAPDLNLIGAGQDRVNLAHGAGRQLPGQQLRVAIFDVLGQEPVDPLTAPPREDLMLAQRPVAHDRLRCPAALREYHVQVPGQHLPHCPDPARLPGLPGVPLALQVANRSLNGRQRFTLDVSAVGLAIGLNAHPDTRLVIAPVIRGFPDP